MTNVARYGAKQDPSPTRPRSSVLFLQGLIFEIGRMQKTSLLLVSYVGLMNRMDCDVVFLSHYYLGFTLTCL